MDEGIMRQLWFEKLPTNDDAHIPLFCRKKTLFDLAEFPDKIADNYDIDHTVSAIQSESKKDYPKELESRLSKLCWKFDCLMNDRRSQSDYCQRHRRKPSKTRSPHPLKHLFYHYKFSEKHACIPPCSFVPNKIFKRFNL